MLMKAIIICFVLSTLISCRVDRNFNTTFTEKDCNIDSVRKQSKSAFARLEKTRKYRNRPFRTDVYENDTAIFVYHIPLDDSIRFGGGTIMEISKKDCKIKSSQTLQ
jgi:hypothetical protein